MTYPFPCVSLTEKQSRHIQAPVLEVILPKLHLNRHTPRAVLFAGPRYGGLRLPEYYTELGFGHLQYLVGHIKLEDDVDNFLLCLITHTQLQVGSIQPFFRLAYPTYASWIDLTWVTDVWKFVHRAHIGIDIERHWVPRLLHHGDAALMDLALQFNFEVQQLYCINLCRLYLQVITVSDISTAKGDQLLQSAQEGRRNDQCVSTLEWPTIPMPPSSHWSHWRTFLQHLSSGKKLTQPLGQWIASPHYKWRWFVDELQTLWENQHETQSWLRYSCLSTRRRLTRRSALVFREGTVSCESPQMAQLLPITVTHRPDGTFSYVASPSPLVTHSPAKPTDFWSNVEVPQALSNTPAFYQHLLNSPPTEEECLTIAKEAMEKTLVISQSLQVAYCNNNLLQLQVLWMDILSWLLPIELS